MDVIAMGISPKMMCEPEEDRICPVISHIAQLAADEFTDMAIDLDLRGTLEMVRYLSSAQDQSNAKGFTALMKCIFLASGKRKARKLLDLLDDCYQKEPLAYEYFMDEFMETDEMDWFTVENIIREAEILEGNLRESGGAYEEM